MKYGVSAYYCLLHFQRKSRELSSELLAEGSQKRGTTLCSLLSPLIEEAGVKIFRVVACFHMEEILEEELFISEGLTEELQLKELEHYLKTGCSSERVLHI